VPVAHNFTTGFYGCPYRNPRDFEHVIDDDRVVVIRPRHRMPIGFVERRWEKLAPIAELGALRAREVLLGERHPQCDVAARGPAPTAYVSAVRKTLRRYFSAPSQPP